MAVFSTAHCTAWTLLFALFFANVRKHCDGPLKRHLYIYDGVFHIAITALGCAALWQHCADAADDDDDIWSPQSAIAVAMRDDWRIAAFPVVHFGHYACALLIVLCTTRRLDMLLHHAFALSLSVVSGVYGVPPMVAALVGVAHSASDVCLIAGKLLRVDRWPTWTSDACMYAFVASWFYLRVYYISAHLWWPIVVHNAMRFAPRVHCAASLAIAVITCLQAYWTVLIVRLTYAKLVHGTTHTDDDDDDDGKDVDENKDVDDSKRKSDT